MFMPPVLPLMKKPARLCLAAGTLFALFLTPLAQGRTWTNLQVLGFQVRPALEYDLIVRVIDSPFRCL